MTRFRHSNDLMMAFLAPMLLLLLASFGCSHLANATAVSEPDEAPCTLKGFDTVTLQKWFWAVLVAPGQLPDSKHGCAFFLSMCHHSPDNIAWGPCPQNSSACLTHDGKTIPLGETPTFKEINDTLFKVIYTANTSEAAGKPAENVTTTLEFHCDPQTTLVGQDGSVSPAIAEQILLGKLNATVLTHTSNEYTMRIKYAGACKQGVNPAPSATGGMGPGGQLFVVLLVLGLLYFGGGIAYNHVNGARGVELLPHHWFWTNLSSYVVDGCLFVVRIVTCQKSPTFDQNHDYGSTSPAGVSPSGRAYETL